MKFKKIFLITLLLLAFLMVSAVSANDNLTDEGILQENPSKEIKLEDANDDIVSSSELNIIGEKDNGTFTALQKKIDDAEDGSTIILENDYTYNEGFSTDGIVINKKLTIDGNGHTLNGLSKSRIFLLKYAKQGTIQNIKFKNGYSVDDGGAIYIKAYSVRYTLNLNIINCEFDNNYAANGGAIATQASWINIKNCIFNNNKAECSGGAIYAMNDMEMRMNILNCDFNSNSANTDGGAIYSQINYLTVNYCNFNDNKAEYGGAIDIDYTSSYIAWEYIRSGGNNTIVSNCNFNRNEVVVYGGAINWNGDNGCLNSSTFNYNTAGHSCDAVQWYGENGVINNCKSFTTGNKDKNLYVPRDTNTIVNGFDIIVVKPTSDSQSSSSSSSSGSQSSSDTSKTIKATPKLIAKKVTFKVKQKTKKYTAILKTDKNKALKKVTLYLKVKGKTYTAKTNSKGKAIFKIKNLKKKGTYKATVTFKGNSNYNKVTKTVKIKVK